MSRFRILSLDGGGVRGIIQAIVLERLSEKLPGWRDDVDLIAGTSSGGLLALSLAHGLEPREIREFYVKKGPRVFDDSWLDNLLDLGKTVGAQYDAKNLVRELRSIFGETTLGELRKRVLVTAFDLDNESVDPAERRWKPKLFHNFPGRENDRRELAYKVGVYACAAPTYFASVDGYIDGGVYANNPSMCALAQSQDSRYIKPPPRMKNVVLLSLGTGMSLKYIRGKALDWGYAQWARPIIEIMMDGVSGIADYECEKILKKNYHRFAPAFPPGTVIPMDAASRIPELVAFAEGLELRGIIRWVEEKWLS